MEVYTHSILETQELAISVSQLLRPKDILAFKGGLGVGKTTFIKGVAKGLNVKDRVKSPTFDIVNEYSGTLPLIHFDFYRITSDNDLYDAGFFDYLERDAVLAIEWSEKLSSYLPQNHIIISIDMINDTTRKFTINEVNDENSRFR